VKVRVLLISTYDLGRQPLGLASPAAWLRNAGVDVDCVDTSRCELSDAAIRAADVVAFHLPMHTATRLAGPLIDRVRRVKASARLAAYGLYAPLNDKWLRGRGIEHVFGPDAEADLVRLAAAVGNGDCPASVPDRTSAEPAFIAPDRRTLPPLATYAAVQMPDGTRRVVGNAETTRGCKHLCRHCPIVPVYGGRFRAVPVDVVLEDIRAQVEAGAQHITFTDADFFNGPTHAQRVVERLARQFPGLTYDVTIKVEHIVKHAELLPVLRDTGCLFVTSAVESIDSAVLEKLRKGHTRADFVRAVTLCRQVGLALSPTFVPFTPWTTLDGYLELLDEIAALDLVADVPPVQLGIRLLITARSALLELPEIQELVDPFDSESLVWPWRHRDPRVDALQAEVMRLAGQMAGSSRAAAFQAIYAAAARATGRPIQPPAPSRDVPVRRPAPYLTEAWYCCAEPMEMIVDC
jgi:radical SAM superfamily enzyme YgiQ (UPF0313 family)